MATTRNEPATVEERIGSLYSEHLEWRASARSKRAEAEQCRRTGKHEAARQLLIEAQADGSMTMLVRQDLRAAGVTEDEVMRLEHEPT